MAEQIISDVLIKLGDLLIKECLFLRGVGDQVEFVKIQLGQMRSFLKGAEEKKIKGDNGTQQWVRDVRDVAFEIENAIDKYNVEIHNVRGKHVPLWERCVLKPTRWIYVHKLGNKISTIQEKIKTISESRTRLGIRDLGVGIVEENPLLKNLVIPDIDNEEIVGFEIDKEQIINALVDGANAQKQRVVSIVGVGGLGKTTLAKKIYNNTKVTQFFNIRVWLTISQNFKPIFVVKKLYEEVTGNKNDKVEDEQVYFTKVYNFLRDKIYLIVLDDVWNEDVFERLKNGFPDVGNGSKVIMTTRFLDVGKLADFNSVFELPFLDEKESLELLLKNALQIRDPLVNCPNELRDVATKLAGRCEGLPLAIVVLGRLLSKKPRDRAPWSEVEKNLDWYHDAEKCMNILATSYHDLPYYLKSCFRYLACFPEDHEFDVPSLLRMWIAEGFMDYKKKGTLEKQAEHCLEELAQRSLVQGVERGFNGSIESFRVHDLLRDLAIYEARENDFLFIYNKENPQTDFNRARRVVIHNYHESGSANKNLENIAMPNIRSFLNFGEEVPVGIRYPLLRVLELKRSREFTKLPKEVKSMIHLRYLGLSDTGLEELPETIGCLRNLQTINIWCTKVKKIPRSLWGIQALRHVRLNKLVPGPPPLANLENLQTLEFATVPESWRDGLPHLPSLRNLGLINKKKDGSTVMPNLNVVINLLGTLNNLVLLYIDGDNIPADIADVRTSPNCYENLKALTLFGSRDIEPPYSTRFFLDTVEMPRNLIELRLGFIWLDKDLMPKLEKLPCLKSLFLLYIENVEEMVCSAGGFPQLQLLHIWGVHDLKHWEVEKEAMPLLKTLKIRYCMKLSALPDLNHVKTLQQLELSMMSDALKSKLDDRTGEEWQKIQHVPTIEIY